MKDTSEQSEASHGSGAGHWGPRERPCKGVRGTTVPRLKMTEHQRETDQVAQRRANFEALRNLGVEQYPHAYDRSHTVTALVDAYSARTGEELTAERIETRTAGRVLAIRSFGKANFLVISD